MVVILVKEVVILGMLIEVGDCVSGVVEFANGGGENRGEEVRDVVEIRESEGGWRC